MKMMKMMIMLRQLFKMNNNDCRINDVQKKCLIWWLQSDDYNGKFNYHVVFKKKILREFAADENDEYVEKIAYDE